MTVLCLLSTYFLCFLRPDYFKSIFNTMNYKMVAIEQTSLFLFLMHLNDFETDSEATTRLSIHSTSEITIKGVI